MAEESNTDGLQLNMKNKTKSASKEREHIVLNPKYLISHSFKPKSPNWFDLCEKIESENEMYVNIRSENKKNKNDSEFQQDNNSKQILWSIGSSGISCIDLKSNKVMDTTKLWKDTTSENSAKLLDYNNNTVKNIAHQAHKQLVFQTQEFDFDSDYNSE
ncbi:PREDICTED: uncharacterized protein LOC107065763 [Polistes dominula]|uniref:Uncharacterized protein LOC107065763 n=1 Tax=Polistes dominula TaxID=743375 RepID=A0ABM1I4T6_POLDO|nr:PREDICTED: uncharacterized protein LOC107065763 [Polistes dominula]